MSVTWKESGFGLQLGDKPTVSKSCLEELRKIQKKMAEQHQGSFEFFDFGLEHWAIAGEGADSKIDRITRICIWHAIGLKHEFKLKLLYTIEGYLTAVDAKNPISTFLLARYLLELVATVSEIDFLLEESFQTDFRDWNRRGISFLAVLYRARHSTSDEKFKKMFSSLGIPADYVHPIKISKALKRLTSRFGFSSATSIYNMLSNICHHNGSGHKMLAESIRETNVIGSKGDRAFFLKEKAAAVAVSYPASSFASNSLGLTARVAWWSAHSANEIIEKFREAPFTGKEIARLTDGRLTSPRPVDVVAGLPQELEKKWRGRVIKVGRNDPCPCGSGKRYKICCLNKHS